MASFKYSKPRQVRTVTMGSYAHKAGTRGRPMLWAFSYYDFADLFGVSYETIRKLVKAGTFDPTDLRSICDYWAAQQEKLA